MPERRGSAAGAELEAERRASSKHHVARGASRWAKSLARAGRAHAIEHHRVLFDSELRRHQLAEIVEAPCDVEHSVALFALKVVMVPLVRPFVSSWLAGNLHRVNPAVI